MHKPLVSIIIPTYNRAHCIAQAIRSALKQTFRDFELIIADDGSTDSTEQAVTRMGEPAVRFVRKANGGCSSARNFGVANASGKYVAFLDSDDEWDPRWLATTVAMMEADAGVGAVYGSLALVGADGRDKGVFDLSLGGQYREATVPYVLSQASGLLGSNIIARREVVQQIGGWDETFPTSGDFEFGLRLAVATRVGLVAAPMIRLIETAGSLSKKVNSGNRLRVLEKFTREQPAMAAKFAPIIRRSRAAILRSYGEDCMWFGRYEEAATQLSASLRTQFNWNALWLLAKLQALRVTGRKPGNSRAG
jgi:glycosyltransferase involved in cell wall biosynthesis